MLIIHYKLYGSKKIERRFRYINNRITSIQKNNEKKQRELQKQIFDLQNHIELIKKDLAVIKEKIKHGKILIGNNENKNDDAVVLYDEFITLRDSINNIDQQLYTLKNNNQITENKCTKIEQKISHMTDNNPTEKYQTINEKINKLQTEFIDHKTQVFRKFEINSKQLDNLSIIINNLPVEKVRYGSILEKINQLELYISELNRKTTFSNTISHQMSNMKNKLEIFIEEFKGKEISIKLQNIAITSRDTSFTIVDQNSNIEPEKEYIPSEETSKENYINSNKIKKRSQIN